MPETNAVQIVDHPPGLTDKTLFRPTVIPYDSTSVLMVSARTETADSTRALLSNFWKYDVNDGWTDLGDIPAGLEDLHQNGVIPIEDPAMFDFNGINTCIPQ